MFLIKLEGQSLSDGVTYIKGMHVESERYCCMQTDLEAGDYILFIELNWIKKHKMNKYTVSCYGGASVIQNLSDDKDFLVSKIIEETLLATAAQMPDGLNVWQAPGR
jgi:hypothetical protein